MAKTLPRHGTLHRRKIHGCGCQLCLEVDRAYTNTRTRLQAYGQWQPYVDAQPARDHVQALMAAGIGWMRIAQLSGVSNGALSKLLYGDSKRGIAPCKRIRPHTEQRLLAVQYSLDHVADSARIDATGTRRRLQALVTVGWPQSRIAHETGLGYQVIHKGLHAETVQGATARAVRAAYRRLTTTQPTGIDERYIRKARQIAARRGWHGPLSWDDIDNPDEQPDTDDAPSTPRYQAIAEDGLWLEAQGYTRGQAAERLGIRRDHLQTSILRARAAQQTDMEEAA